MQDRRLTHPGGMGIVAPVITPVVAIKKVQRLHSRGALPEVDRSHPSGSLFLVPDNRRNDLHPDASPGLDQGAFPNSHGGPSVTPKPVSRNRFRERPALPGSLSARAATAGLPAHRTRAVHPGFLPGG